MDHLVTACNAVCDDLSARVAAQGIAALTAPPVVDLVALEQASTRAAIEAFERATVGSLEQALRDLARLA